MEPAEAKRLVLQREERSPINKRWLAERLGIAHQSVSQWLKGTEPRDPHVWVRIADALALTVSQDPLMGKARELALEVMVRSEDRELRSMAATLIREISEKSYG